MILYLFYLTMLYDYSNGKHGLILYPMVIFLYSLWINWFMNKPEQYAQNFYTHCPFYKDVSLNALEAVHCWLHIFRAGHKIRHDKLGNLAAVLQKQNALIHKPWASYQQFIKQQPENHTENTIKIWHNNLIFHPFNSMWFMCEEEHLYVYVITLSSYPTLYISIFSFS